MDIGDIVAVVGFRINTADLTAKLSQAEQLATQHPVQIKVGLDVSQVAAQVQKIGADLTRNSTLRVSLDNSAVLAAVKTITTSTEQAASATQTRINSMFSGMSGYAQGAARASADAFKTADAEGQKSAANYRNTLSLNMRLENEAASNYRATMQLNLQLAAQRAAAEKAVAAAAISAAQQSARAFNDAAERSKTSLDGMRLAYSQARATFDKNDGEARNWQEKRNAALAYQQSVKLVSDSLLQLKSSGEATVNQLKQIADMEARLAREQNTLAGGINRLGMSGNFSNAISGAQQLSMFMPGLIGQSLGAASAFTQIAESSGVMGVALGAAGLAVFALGKTFASTSEAFGSFQQGLQGISSIDTSLSGVDMQGIADGLQKLSTELPITTEQLTNMARGAVQMGITGKEGIMEFTNSIALLAVATRENNKSLGDTGQLANELGVFLNETGSTARTYTADLKGVVATLAAVDKVTPGTIQSTLSLARYMASGSVVLNLNKESIIGLSGALSGLGARAEAGGSAVIRVLMAMNRAAGGTKEEMAGLEGVAGITKDELANVFQGSVTVKANAFASVMGVTSEQFKIMVKNSPAQAFQLLAEGLARAHAAGIDMTAAMDDMGIKNVRDIRLVDQLTVGHANLKLALDASSNGAKNQADLQDRVSKATQNSVDKTTELKNAWTTFYQSAGNTPIMNSILDFLKKAAEGAKEWADNMHGVSSELTSWSKMAGIDLNVLSPETAARVRQLVADMNAMSQASGGQMTPTMLAKYMADAKELEQIRLRTVTAQGSGAVNAAGPLRPGQTRGTYDGQPAPAAGIIVEGEDIKRLLGLPGLRTGTPYGGKYFGGEIHNGEDVFAPTGTPLSAPFEAYATTRWSKTTGHVIELIDAAGQKLLLGHLDGYADGLEAAIKAAGGKLLVKQGQLLGYVGQTGSKAHADLGPGNSHVHYMAYDASGKIVNPNTLPFRGITDTPITANPNIKPGGTGGATGPTEAELRAAGQKIFDAYYIDGDHSKKVVDALRAFRKAHADIWQGIMADGADAKKKMKALGLTDDEWAKYKARAMELVALQEKRSTGKLTESESLDAKQAIDSFNSDPAKAKAFQFATEQANSAKALAAQNKQLSDQAKAAAVEAANFQKTLNRQTSDAGISEAQARLKSLEANRDATLQSSKKDAATQLQVEREKGQAILNAQQNILGKQRDQAIQAAHDTAEASRTAADKLFKGKTPQSRLNEIAALETRQINTANSNYDTDAATAQSVQDKRLIEAKARLKVEQDKTAEDNRTRIAEEAQFSKQVDRDLAAGKISSAEATIRSQEAARQRALTGAKGDAEKELQIEQQRDAAILTNQLSVLSKRRQQALQSAHDTAEASRTAADKQYDGKVPKAITDQINALEASNVKAAWTTYSADASTAQDQMASRITAATTKVHEAAVKQAQDLIDLTRSYKTAQESFSDKLISGDITDKDVTDYLTSLSDLWNKAGTEGLKGNAQIVALHAAAKQLADPSIIQGMREAAIAYGEFWKAQDQKYGNGGAAADAGMRAGYGVGQEGLSAALTGSGANIKLLGDPEAALADLDKFNHEAADRIRRVYVDELAEFKNYHDSLNASILETTTAAYAQIKQGMADEQAAADEANTTVESLTGMFQRVIANGLDPQTSGYVQLLDEIIAKGGQAGKAAQQVKDNLQQLLFLSGATDDASVMQRINLNATIQAAKNGAFPDGGRGTDRTTNDDHVDTHFDVEGQQAKLTGIQDADELATLEHQHNLKLVSESQYLAKREELQKIGAWHTYLIALQNKEDVTVAAAQLQADLTKIEQGGIEARRNMYEGSGPVLPEKEKAWMDNQTSRQVQIQASAFADLSDEVLAADLATAKLSHNTEDYNAILAEQERRLQGTGGQFTKLVTMIDKVSKGMDIASGLFSRFSGGEATAAGAAFDWIGMNVKAASQALSGDWMGAIATTINGIGDFAEKLFGLSDAVKANRKELMAMADLETSSAGGKKVGLLTNPYYDALQEDAAKRQTLAKAGFWQRLGWNLFGGAPEVLSDEAAKLKSAAADIFNDLGSSISSNLSSSLMNAFNTADWFGSREMFEKSFNQMLAQMYINATIKASGLEGAIQAYADAKAAGRDGAAELTSLRNIASGVFNTAQAGISALPGYGGDAANGLSGSSNISIAGAASTPQFGAGAALEIKFPDYALTALSDFASSMPIWSTTVGEFRAGVAEWREWMRDGQPPARTGLSNF